MLHYITLLFHSAVVEVQAWTGLREPSAAPGLCMSFTEVSPPSFPCFKQQALKTKIQICWIIALRERLLILDEDLKNQWRCSRGGLQAASPPPLGVWQGSAQQFWPSELCVCVVPPHPHRRHPTRHPTHQKQLKNVRYFPTRAPPSVTQCLWTAVFLG